MKKLFLGGIVFILFLPFFSCNNFKVPEFNFLYPKDGDYITKNSLIIVEFSEIKNLKDLKLIITDERFTKVLEYEIKENRLYSSFPSDLFDGEYKISVNFYLYGKSYKKEINVILNSEVPIWENFVYPLYIRSGREIQIESISSTPLKEVKAYFDDGTILDLEYLKDKDLWIGNLTISNFLTEGSHIVKFVGIDLKGERLEDTKIFYIINSNPVIYSPIDGLETTSNEITIYGFYEQDKNIMIYLNNKPYKEIKVDATGNFFENLILLPGNYTIFAKDENSPFIGKSSLQNINIKIFNEGVIVLCYHNIDKRGGNLYTISPEDFENQIKYMIEKGYKSISIDEFYDYYFNKKDIPKKSVLITFDDGLKGVYEYAYPILKKYNYKATFFVIVGRVGRVKNYVNWEQLREMVESGVFSIGSHTYDSHKTYLVNGRYISIIVKNGNNENYESFKNRVLDDFSLSKMEIEKYLNIEVFSFAYPYGEFSIDTINFLKEANYKFAFTVIKGLNTKRTSRFELKRYSIYRGTNIKEIIN